MVLTTSSRSCFQKRKLKHAWCSFTFQNSFYYDQIFFLHLLSCFCSYLPHFKVQRYLYKSLQLFLDDFSRYFIIPVRFRLTCNITMHKTRSSGKISSYQGRFTVGLKIKGCKKIKNLEIIEFRSKCFILVHMQTFFVKQYFP